MRGFKLPLPGAAFKDVDGRECSIQESSLATEPGLRFGADRGTRGEEQERMHLTQTMVRELLPLLRRFARTGNIGSGRRRRS